MDVENIIDNDYQTDFEKFPKISRLSRECIISEKIDGTNAQILITPDGKMLVGSRRKWLTLNQDNAGFAHWAHEHQDELRTLGVGRHFGEWWGQGIRRKYGMTEKRFSLFNLTRWCLHGETPEVIPSADPRIIKIQDVLPPCCHLVPMLRRGEFSTTMVESALHELREGGSVAAPGYMNPEGVVIFHIAGNVCFKKTLDSDGVPKGKAR